MKILNLYSGIGGNRKLWQDVEVTAVEHDERIAKIYSEHFPNDTVIVGDAHEYLLKNYKLFDFIWSSPPCPTHSRFNLIQHEMGAPARYPDMTLYQEILLLKHWYDGKYCVENVISYYDPLISPVESGNHYFWTNFRIKKEANKKRNIRREDKGVRERQIGFDLSKHELTKRFERTLINNCTEPELGLYILLQAQGVIREESSNQLKLAI